MRKSWGILVLSLALGGCTVTNVDAPESGGSESPRAEATDEEAWRSPLDEYLPYRTATEATDEQKAASDAESRRYEELTAQCMVEQGFEYYVYTPWLDGTLTPEERIDPNEGKTWAEIAAIDGYGMYSVYLGQINARDNPQPHKDTGPIVDNDPNQAVYEAMSDAEKTAYSLALHGPSCSDEENCEWKWEAKGCNGWAHNEVWPGTGPGGGSEMSPESEELLTSIYQLRDKFEETPEGLALNQTWSQCMTNEGFPGYATESAPFEDLQDRYETAVAAGATTADLEKIRSEEIKVAIAHATCGSTMDSTEAKEQYFAFEQKFVDEHKKALEILRSELELQQY